MSIIKHGVICRMPDNKFGYFGWPSIARMDDGTLLLVYNPVTESWGARSPITIAESKDNGETWRDLCDLQTEPGEFSYPAITHAENKVYITYTYKRENIAYWEFEYEE